MSLHWLSLGMTGRTKPDQISKFNQFISCKKHKKDTGMAFQVTVASAIETSFYHLPLYLSLSVHLSIFKSNFWV